MVHPKRELKAAVKALYTIDPILWATVKGYDTPTKIQTKLQWSERRLAYRLDLALKQNRITWQNRKLRPVQDEHKILRRRLLR